MQLPEIIQQLENLENPATPRMLRNMMLALALVVKDQLSSGEEPADVEAQHHHHHHDGITLGLATVNETVSVPKFTLSHDGENWLAEFKDYAGGGSTPKEAIINLAKTLSHGELEEPESVITAPQLLHFTLEDKVARVYYQRMATQLLEGNGVSLDEAIVNLGDQVHDFVVTASVQAARNSEPQTVTADQVGDVQDVLKQTDKEA